MSNDIKVGDVCLVLSGGLCGQVAPDEIVGHEVVVVGPEQLYQPSDYEVFGFEVMRADGRRYAVARRLLRKKPPKQREDAEPRTDFTKADPDAWELTGFDPSKTRTKETA